MTGFRGIDTANQKKHYREDYVGDALLALKRCGISRENFFVQSKYTYLLHGPRSGRGLTDADWQVWAAMEELQKAGKTRLIGVSNVGLRHLTELCEKAKIKPQMVQNRCFAAYGWDQEVREYCLSNKIVYQGFSLLTANPQVVSDRRVADIARRLNATPEQVLFSFA